MSDISDTSLDPASDREPSETEEDFGVVGGPVEPYRFEPVAPEGYEEPDEDEDEDGLTPEILEARMNNQIPLGTWCNCGKCRVELLSSALAYRCCKEVAAAVGKFTSEGIDDTCIMEHTDFDALTNSTVLENGCPLMKDRLGWAYRFPTRGTESAKNESRRATAYRFLVRWIFGPLGWDHTRPLPACIYQAIRTKFHTATTRGYMSSKQRDA